MFYESRSDFAFGLKRNRVWPVPPIEVLLKHWLKRVLKNSEKFGRPYRCELRQKYATTLGLPTRWVEIKADGTLWHESRDEPIFSL